MKTYLLVMTVVLTITLRNHKIERVAKLKTYVYEKIPYYNPYIRNTNYHNWYVGRNDNGEIKKSDEFCQGESGNTN